jgi:hypothetical protein
MRAAYQIVTSRIIVHRTQIEFFVIVIFAFLLVVDAHFPFLEEREEVER